MKTPSFQDFKKSISSSAMVYSSSSLSTVSQKYSIFPIPNFPKFLFIAQKIQSPQNSPNAHQFPSFHPDCPNFFHFPQFPLKFRPFSPLLPMSSNQQTRSRRVANSKLLLREKFNGLGSQSNTLKEQLAALTFIVQQLNEVDVPPDNYDKRAVLCDR